MEWMSLDGVVQSPMYPDEDTSGGFRHGGWHGPYLDEVAQEWVTETIASADAYLFGRGTYDRFAAYWPTAGPEVRVLAEPLNTRPKYVASHRPLTPEWSGAVRLDGDVRDVLGRMKGTEAGTLLLIGSPGLAQSLLAWSFVDELRLMVDPVVVGSGKRLFGAPSRHRQPSVWPRASPRRAAHCSPTTCAGQPLIRDAREARIRDSREPQVRGGRGPLIRDRGETAALARGAP